MAYVSGDGNVLQTEPWSLKRVFGFFSSILFGITMFFNTLINPAATKRGKRAGFSGGSGPGFFQGGKKIHGLNLKPSMNVPGGCTSCAK